ncbi:hypothetical protein IIB34_02770, partial [PVC group bacterium]|nr:hypothetical protein [PVC group bacterium]
MNMIRTSYRNLSKKNKLFFWLFAVCFFSALLIGFSLSHTIQMKGPAFIADSDKSRSPRDEIQKRVIDGDFDMVREFKSSSVLGPERRPLGLVPRLNRPGEHEAYLEDKGQSILDLIFGADHSMMKIYLEWDHEKRTTRKETLDPNGVVTSENITKEFIVPADAVSQALSEMVREREEIVFTSGRTIEERVLNTSRIKRMSIMIMIHHEYQMPSMEDTLSKVERLIKQALGFNFDRGDEFTITKIPLFTTDTSTEGDSSVLRQLLGRLRQRDLTLMAGFLGWSCFLALGLIIVVRQKRRKEKGVLQMKEPTHPKINPYDTMLEELYDLAYDQPGRMAKIIEDYYCEEKVRKNI